MIIGLTGYAQSGKDTVAAFLVEHYGYKRVAFADKIRDLLFKMNPIVEPDVRLQEVIAEMGWEKAKVRIPEVRRIMQELGVGAREVFGDNHWIVEAYKDMDLDSNYVITDVRFANEANWVKAFNGDIWRVTRDGIGPVNGHVSESELDSIPYDTLITNDGDLKDLFSEVAEALVVYG